jgi:peptidyl-prolyl cis-trans isomerase A (cyclophilin A)
VIDRRLVAGIDWVLLGTTLLLALIGVATVYSATHVGKLSGLHVKLGSVPAVAARPVGQTNARGTVSFATSGPNSRTTQVFINLANNARLDKSGFAPIGAVTSGMEIVDEFYADYADGPPLGPGPSQTRIETEGNAYLERDFPKLDYIKKATIMD